MKKYLILGGAGFIGHHLVSELAKHNKVIVADIAEKSPFEELQNVEYIFTDFVKTIKFDILLENVDVVIHLVSTVLPEDGTLGIIGEIEANVFPTIHLLDSMIRCKVKKILFVSSGGTVYGENDGHMIIESENQLPVCKYGIHKLMIEKYLHLYQHYHNIDYTVIRLSNPYGLIKNLNRKQGAIPIFVNKCLNNESITIWGDGSNIRDYIYIKDAISGILSLLTYKGPHKIFNVGFGKGYSLNEIVEKIKNALSSSISTISYSEKRLCDVGRNVLKISLIEECTGWYPKVDIDYGIHLTINELQNESNKL